MTAHRAVSLVLIFAIIEVVVVAIIISCCLSCAPVSDQSCARMVAAMHDQHEKHERDCKRDRELSYWEGYGAGFERGFFYIDSLRGRWDSLGLSDRDRTTLRRGAVSLMEMRNSR